VPTLRRNSRHTIPSTSTTKPSTRAMRASSSRPRPAPAELPNLLTVDEVAALLRTSRRAVYTRIRRGSIPGVIRVSRRLLIDSSILIDWLREKRTASLTQGDQQ